MRRVPSGAVGRRNPLKEVLIAGNSQLGALRSAYLLDKDAFSARLDITFFATPGGSGPYMAVENGRLVASDRADPNRVFWSPAKASERPIDSYDAVVVSALGFIDGFTNDLPAAARVRLSTFKPLDRGTVPFVSGACFRELIRAALSIQPGFVFLRNLREVYKGEVIVQPFPYHPSGVTRRTGWQLASRYDDSIGYYKFLSKIKDSYLSQTCSSLGVNLLDYPFADLRSTMFTPEDLVDPKDFVHPNTKYGAAVLQQIAEVLATGEKGS